MNPHHPKDRRPASRSRIHAKNRLEIQERLATYKNAKPQDVAYYTRVVREVPARAVDMLLYKDMIRDDEVMILVEQAMPELLKIYDALDREARARIDERVGRVGPYQKGKTFVSEILREVNRVSRQRNSSQNGPAGAPI